MLSLTFLGPRPLSWAADVASLISPGAPPNSVDFNVAFSPHGHDRPQIIDQRARINWTVTQSTPIAWSFHQRVGTMDVNNGPPLGSSGVDVPSTLWDIEMGGVLRRTISERRGWGLNTSIGSASDEPFQSMRETTLRLGAYSSIPSGQNNSWLFSLNYSNNRYFANNIPLPGVAYLIQSPDQRWTTLIGFPFLAMVYRPNENWSHRIRLFGPTNLSAGSEVRVKRFIKLHGGFEWTEQSWLRANRSHHRDRLFLSEKKWVAGFQVPVTRSLAFHFSGGYKFNRQFFEAESALKDHSDNADLGSTRFLQTQLGIRFKTESREGGRP